MVNVVNPLHSIIMNIYELIYITSKTYLYSASGLIRHTVNTAVMIIMVSCIQYGGVL